MPEENGEWRDWTAEEYAQTDEWQRQMEQEEAEAIDAIERGAGLPWKKESDLNRVRAAFARRRAEGPSASELNQINNMGMEQQGRRAEIDQFTEALGGAPKAEPMSMAMTRRYGLGEMDIGGRAAALQAGAASQRLGGMNPAARTMALSEISRGGSGMMGQGVGGAAQMANQNLLASYQGQLQDRQMQGNALQGSINQGYAMEQIGTQHQNALELAKLQFAQQQRLQQRGGGFWGAMGSLAGTLVGGPFGSALGGYLFNRGGQSGGRYAS